MDTTADTLPRLGIDIGRVIIDGGSHPDGGDTAFFAGGIGNTLAPRPWPGSSRSCQRWWPASAAGPG